MQRPWGRTMLEEQPGGLCGQNRVSDGENSRRGGERGLGQVVQGLQATRRTRAFTPREV